MVSRKEGCTMKLSFLGAAGEVTGSCLRVDHDPGAFLVDCGMFQGGSAADIKNRRALDFDLTGIDFVLLTHANLDHCGLVPRLVALGYKGPILATPATLDLVLLIVIGLIGGAGALMMAQAFRVATPSVLVPFEYTGMVWGVLIDLSVWGKAPQLRTLLGAGIVIAAGVLLLRQARDLNR